MDPTGRSPWAVLGVDEHALLAEVQHAFRSRAKQTHPDRGGDRRAFEDVRTAYDAVRHGAPRRVAWLRPNPYAWCDQPYRPMVPPAPAPAPARRPRSSALQFADVLEGELRKVRVASAA